MFIHAANGRRHLERRPQPLVFDRVVRHRFPAPLFEERTRVLVGQPNSTSLGADEEPFNLSEVEPFDRVGLADNDLFLLQRGDDDGTLEERDTTSE